MKVPPKRKGNNGVGGNVQTLHSLNESPSEKEGKSPKRSTSSRVSSACLNESPSEKEGKSPLQLCPTTPLPASMKVPPKRKGNREEPQTCNPNGIRLNESPSEKEGKLRHESTRAIPHQSLNESPSEKEGKSSTCGLATTDRLASMKVPPKRKGNI